MFSIVQWLFEQSKLVAHLAQRAENIYILDGATYLSIGSAAYQFCMATYGNPIDPDCPIVYKYSYVSACCYNCLKRQYEIHISEDLKTRDQLIYIFAHEMYHRFTIKRKDICTEPWCDEMFAHLTAVWFLEESGHEQYARYLRFSGNPIPAGVNFTLLKQILPSRSLKNIVYGHIYPDWFYYAVQNLGLRLEDLVGKELVLQLLKQKNMDEWIHILPIELQNRVRKLLESEL